MRKKQVRMDPCIQIEKTKFLENPDSYEPVVMSNGETLMTQMIKLNEIKLVADLLEAENGLKFQEMKNASGKLPIFVAIDLKAYEIIHEIILESMTMNLKDEDGISPAEHVIGILNEVSKKKDEQLKKSKRAKKTKELVNEVDDLEITIQMLILRGVEFEELIPQIEDRKIRKDIALYYKQQTTDPNEFIEIDKMMCFCKKNEAEYVLKCHHLICGECIETIMECPHCPQVGPFTKDQRIYQV